jgi:hypothetical protein
VVLGDAGGNRVRLILAMPADGIDISAALGTEVEKIVSKVASLLRCCEEE